MAIKIINANEVSKDFYQPRTLGSSVTEKVQTFIAKVKAQGDEGLHQINDELFNAGFDKASPDTFEMPKEILKAKTENKNTIEHTEIKVEKEEKNNINQINNSTLSDQAKMVKDLFEGKIIE